MSRFSTIDGQHSALRDLERQRLEKLMGQLRREVEPTAKARRFQPPRRKERVSKARNEREVLTRDAPCTANEHSCVPMPPPLPRTTTPRGTVNAANALSAPTAPSAEMAWLLRVSERFDEEAAQVHAFLAEHSLEQYAALLESGPGAPGSSMEALQAASAELLEQVGLPPSPRRRLLNALEVQGDLNSEQQTQGDHDFAPHWGRLGRMPWGWHRCEGRNARVVTRSAPVSHADAAVGDDSPRRAVEEVMDEVMIPSTSSKAIGNSEELHHSFQPAEQVHHAATSSRPGSSSGAEKGCCYQCYRKVYLSVAFHLPMEVSSRPGTPFDGDSRVFCSTSCMDGFREALAVRNQRAAELCKLREALGNVEAPLPQVHEHVSDQ